MSGPFSFRGLEGFAGAVVWLARLAARSEKLVS
jgi:hypothetical protein